MLSEGAILVSGHGLTAPWKAFVESLILALPLQPSLEKPADYITVQADPENEAKQVASERVVLDLVFKSMHRTIAYTNKKKNDKKVLGSQFLREMNPLISDLKDCISSSIDTCSTHLVFGLQLLVES